MPEYLIDEDVKILVEFSTPVQPGGTVRQAALPMEAIPGLSQKALNKAMGAIKQMAKRVVAVKNSLEPTELPSTIEVAFALKLDSEASVYIAKFGTEASFNVKLVWERGSDDK